MILGFLFFFFIKYVAFKGRETTIVDFIIEKKDTFRGLDIGNFIQIIGSEVFTGKFLRKLDVWGTIWELISIYVTVNDLVDNDGKRREDYARLISSHSFLKRKVF